MVSVWSFYRVRLANAKQRIVRRLGFALAILPITGVEAHFPHRESRTVHTHSDLIPSVGANLPSYRERYNRPRYIGGKIAYYIEPTSQEAMSWHRSVHRGYYGNHAPRMEDRYFYPKPWEALSVGPRTPITAPSDRGTNKTAEEIPSPEGSRETNRQNEYEELPPAIGPVPAPTP